MSSDKNQLQHTQHAWLIAWGAFADHIGLPQKVQAVQVQLSNYSD